VIRAAEQVAVVAGRYLPGELAARRADVVVSNGVSTTGYQALAEGPTPQITSTAPVNTILSQAIVNGGGSYDGFGIYEREGWKPGDTGDRAITFSQSGGGGTYAVSWLGNDGTFSSPSTLTIPANGSANLAVHIAPAGSGIHSAIVRLDDPASAGIEYAALNTVVVADQFPSTYQITKSAAVARADKQSFFINVAPGTSALRLDESITAGRTKLDITDPFGVPYVLPFPCGCANDFTTGPATRTTSIQDPVAGVWEVDIETSRTAPLDPSTASFTASELAVGISPAEWTVDPATVGTTYSQPFTFTNLRAPFTGGAVGTAFGSGFKATSTATDDHDGSTPDDQQTFSIVVPAGATNLHVQIGNPADPLTDLDLFLIDPSGNLVKQSAGSTANEHVDLANPAAGTYTAIVDDFSVPSGSTTYSYSDLIALPGLGSVTISDPAAAHATGSSWSSTASAVANAAPSAGRFLQFVVQVTAGGAVVGQAEVGLHVH